MHPIVIVFVFITVYCVANGQQIESQWNAKSTGEWVMHFVFVVNYNNFGVVDVDVDVDRMNEWYYY